MPTKSNKENVRESTNYNNPYHDLDNFIVRYIPPKPKPSRDPKFSENWRVHDALQTNINFNKIRDKEANKYSIPYIPEKEIRLTTGRYNTGKISTNLLDSIYNASQRTGVPLDIALGLAGRESTLGIGRGFKRGQSINGTDLYSNWQQIAIAPHSNKEINNYNELVKKYNKKLPLTKEEANYMISYIEAGDKAAKNIKPLNENPIDNALKFYQTGKYNPGDSRHSQMVEEDAKILMSDPAIQKWLQTKNNNKMKCGGRRKAQLGLDIREGGIAIPIAPNMYYMDGRSHDNGGIAIGPNNKNGLEVEGGEVVKVGNNDIKVFSSVPLLRGVSPAQLVLGGANPNTVFKAQEDFKDRNRINDDGTTYEIGGEKKSNSAIRTEEDKKVSARNRAIYSAVDATADYPTWWQAIGLGIGSNFKTIINPDSMNYTVTDSVADAAWRKRLGLSYNDKFLVPNKDGSVRLPRNIEIEIPTDTTMLKKRIAANEKFANQSNIVGEDWQIVQAMMKKDKEALEALRKTYKTGEPVVVNEYAHNNRKLSKNGELIDDAINYKSPLNVMKNYTIQYDPKTRRMNYWDTYDFNEFDWGIPGESFKIKGSIPLKKFGGNMIYTINGNVKNGLNLRPKAKMGKEEKIDDKTKIGEDGLVYKRGADDSWYTDGTIHASRRKITSDKNIKRYSSKPSTPTTLEKVNFTSPLIQGERKKIGNLYYEQTEDGRWKPATNQSSVTTRNSGKPSDFGMTRVGVNHPNGKYTYHPLTGEKINADSTIETEKPSVKSVTKVSSKKSTSSIPRRGESKSAVTTKSKTEPAYINYKPNKVNLAVKADNPASRTLTKIDTPSTGDGTQSKDGRWVGQYKTTNLGDWIGLGSNLAGSVASYFMTKSAIDKMPEALKPVMAQAAKLKTKYNIQPQLTNISEAEQMNRASVRRNTQSSNTSLAREQRLMNEARGARNTLYGQKENIETQLINQDRLNRQSVMKDNVRAYNEYLNKVTATKMAQNEMRASNINNLISGLTGSVNSILGNIESRRATNNTLRAIAAANPNVDARLIGGFDYYIDPITKKKYNKNQQYVGTING